MGPTHPDPLATHFLSTFDVSPPTHTLPPQMPVGTTSTIEITGEIAYGGGGISEGYYNESDNMGDMERRRLKRRLALTAVQSFAGITNLQR